MLAISDKVVIRADDLLTWMENTEWQWGLAANSVREMPAPYDDTDLAVPSLKGAQLDFSDVNGEKGGSRRVAM